MASGFEPLPSLPGAALPADDHLLMEAWKVFNDHGLALHQYNLSRWMSYRAHPDLYAERARVAELHCRAALAASLVAVNELRDTGQGDRVLRELVAQPQKLATFDVASGVAQAVEFLRQELPSVPTELLELLPSFVDQSQLSLSVSPTDEGAQVALTQGGTVYRCAVQSSAQSQHVTMEEFFGRSSQPGPVAVPGFRVQSPTRDWYTGCLLSLASTREWAYRNARNAAELGPPAVSAAAILVIIAGAGVIMMFIGSILKKNCGNKTAICELGDALTGFGLLLEAAGGLGIILVSNGLLPADPFQLPSPSTNGPTDQLAANIV